MTSDRPDPALVGKLRGSVLLLGPLLARKGSARLSQPGGDFPARRTIATHLQALVAMGAVPRPRAGPCSRRTVGPERRLVLSRRGVRDRHRDSTSRGRGGEGAERDPPRRDGTACRRAVPVPARHGRAIEGEGTSTIRVQGPARLRGASHRLDGDYIEAGSWGVVAAITGGSMQVTGARWTDVEVVAAPLKKMGLECSWNDERFVVEPSSLTAIAADHDRPVARVPERHGQPGDGAGDAGRRARRSCTTGCTSCGCSRSSS